MAPDGGSNTVLESTDGQRLELPTHVAVLSGTIRYILEDAAPAAAIRLPMVSGVALGRVMSYCEALHAARAEDGSQEHAWHAIGAPRMLHEIFELAEAANYLDVPELMQAACAAAAVALTRCTQPQTLRSLLRSADGCLRLSGEVQESCLQQVEATTLRRIAAVGGEWGGAATRISEDVTWQSTHLNLRQLMGLPRSNEALRARLVACPNEAREPWPSGRDRGRTPLHVATLRGDSAAVSTLLAAFPAAATLGDRQGRLPLHLAAKAAGSEAARNAIVALAEARRSDRRSVGGEWRREEYGLDSVVDPHRAPPADDDEPLSSQEEEGEEGEEGEEDEAEQEEGGEGEGEGAVEAKDDERRRDEDGRGRCAEGIDVSGDGGEFQQGRETEKEETERQQRQQRQRVAGGEGGEGGEEDEEDEEDGARRAVAQLLAAYPEGARVRDKALMLPLHLAIASGAPDAVCAALLAADMPLLRETGAAAPHQYSWVRALAEPRCAGVIATVLRPEAQGGYGYGEWALGLAERVQDEWRRKAIDCASDGARAALQVYLTKPLPPRPKLTAPSSGGKRAGKKGGKSRDGASALMAKHGMPTR